MLELYFRNPVTPHRLDWMILRSPVSLGIPDNRTIVSIEPNLKGDEINNISFKKKNFLGSMIPKSLY